MNVGAIFGRALYQFFVRNSQNLYSQALAWYLPQIKHVFDKIVEIVSMGAFVRVYSPVRITNLVDIYTFARATVDA